MQIESSQTAVPLTKFYDYVAPEIPGFVSALADQHIVSAAREFCKNTRCWRETLDPIDILAGRNQYDIDVPQDADVFEVARVTYNGTKMEPSSDEVNEEQLGEWRTTVGVPSAYVFFDPGVIVLDRLPEAAINDGLAIEAWLYPSRDAKMLPGLLWSRYAEVIANGAKASLMVMRNKPWTDRELGVGYAAEFHRAIGVTAMRVAKGGARLPLRTRVVHGIKE